MEQRRLGTQGLVVSALGLGCMGMSEFYGTPDEQESLATIHRATGLFRRAEDLPKDDHRVNMPRFQGENFQNNVAIVERITAIAAGKSVTPAQIALAWVLAQGQDIVPIPGTKRRAYLEQNVAALGVRLTSEELRRINEIAPKGIAAGDRYADMSRVNL